MTNTWIERCQDALLTRGYPDDLLKNTRSKLENIYTRFLASGCADTQFDSQLNSQDKNVFAQRFGEMLLFERLTHAGFKLTSKDEGPDFRAEKNGEIIWLELVTPSVGDDSKIEELLNSHAPLSPNADDNCDLSDRTLLRVATAISAKLAKFEGYLEKGLIKSEEARVIVVNDALLTPDCYYYGVSFGADSVIGDVSLVENALAGVGHQYWKQSDIASQYIPVSTFRENAPNRPEPTKDGNIRSPVPVSLFARPTSDWPKALSNRAQAISAVLEVTLKEDYLVLMELREIVEGGNRLGENLLFPGTLVHNPYATVPLTSSVGKEIRRMSNAPDLSPQEFLMLVRQRWAMLTGAPYVSE